jgi:hypothetical protein
MAFLFGKEWTKHELMQRVGDISQLGGVKRFEFADGNEKGVEAVEFRTGTGFRFVVSPSRGMDVSQAEFCGKSLCWRSSTGDVAPEFFEPEGLGWLRSFAGGLLVTCGLTYAGAPCHDDGKDLGLHGRSSNTPAKNLSVDGDWQGDEYVMWATGKVRETTVFGENVLLTRRITTKLGESKLLLEDTVENEGFESVPHMHLYHINGGFPVVDAGSRMISPTISAIPRDDDARIEAEKYGVFLPPTKGFRERCYYHDMKTDADGVVYSALVNDHLDGGFGFYIKYSKNEFPRFIEWKMNGQGTYVVGMEPANCFVEGRDKDRERGILQFLEPGEKRHYHVEIGVLASLDDIRKMEDMISKIMS